MSFEVDQRVVYPVFGLGRIVGRVMKSFLDPEMQEYYEVVGESSTIWVQVNDAAARGLRRLTQSEELPHYRAVLRSQPAKLDPDDRRRHQDISARLKRGTFQDLCEVVRDLSAHNWRAALSEYDIVGLEKSRRWLCQEWALAGGISVDQATTEVNALLAEVGRAYPP